MMTTQKNSISTGGLKTEAEVCLELIYQHVRVVCLNLQKHTHSFVSFIYFTFCQRSKRWPWAREG